jgi:chromosome segregation ATPase
MHKDDAAHRTSTFRRLFAERHVYLRSGSDSRYVVLSRLLQVGVVIGLVLIVGGLAFTGYAAITNHLETVEQGRELARLESANEQLRADAEAAREDAAAQDQANAEVQRLRAALEEARQSVKTRAEEAEGLRRELAQAEQRVAELESTTERASADTASTRLRDDLIAAQAQIEELSAAAAAAKAARQSAEAALAKATATPETEVAEAAWGREQTEAEVTRLSEELARARRHAETEVAELKRRLEGTETEVARLTEELARARQQAETEVAELNRRLEQSGEEVARLTGQLAAAEAAGTETAPATRAAEAPAGGNAASIDALTELKTADGPEEELQQLRVDLASAEATIASLNEDLEAAKGELEAARRATDGGAAPGAAGEVARLRQQLAQANARIDELEGVIGTALVTLAPAPAPPAPR